MEQRNLGRSGLRVSTIGLGCNNFGGRIDLEASRRVVHAALDAGITLFDTADVYGALGTGTATGHRGASEEILGQLLGSHRRDIVLASKFGMAMDDSGKAGRRLPPLHHPRGGGQPDAVAHRLDRPLPAA